MPSVDSLPDEYADFITACVDMIGRTGAEGWELRYDDNDGEGAVVWNALAKYNGGRMEVAAAMLPDQAAFRLLETLCDGAECQNCHRPVAMHIHGHGPEMGDMFCNYTYDQPSKRFRRGCE